MLVPSAGAGASAELPPHLSLQVRLDRRQLQHQPALHLPGAKPRLPLPVAQVSLRQRSRVNQ